MLDTQKQYLKMMPLIVATALTGCASSPFSGAELRKQWIWTGLHAIDWAQARHVAKHPQEFSERNFLLSKHPSEGRVNTFGVGMTAAHWLIARYGTDAGNRKTFQNVSIGLKAGVVAHNFAIGVKADF